MTWDFHPTTPSTIWHASTARSMSVSAAPPLTAMGTDIDIDDVIAIGHDTEAREDPTAAAPQPRRRDHRRPAHIDGGEDGARAS